MRISMPGKLLTVGVLAATAMALTSQTAAFASDFIAYPGPGYSGQAIDLNQCGFNSVTPGYNGSYVFQYTGQNANAYNSPDASGTVAASLSGDASQNTPFGWLSLWIQC